MSETTTTTERPILFSAPMIRAILAGDKTQTRRIVKVPPAYCNWEQTGDNGDGTFRLQGTGVSTWLECPFGKPGDRLWVREAWATEVKYDKIKPSRLPRTVPIWYAADGAKPEWAGRVRPGMFMPRWASRITLEIVSIRAERVGDITAEDATDEGAVFWHKETHRQKFGYAPAGICDGSCQKGQFRLLWDSINGGKPGYSFADNPWVWVVEFKRIDADGAGQ